MPATWLGQTQDLLNGNAWAGTGGSLGQRASQNLLVQETSFLAKQPACTLSLEDIAWASSVEGVGFKKVSLCWEVLQLVTCDGVTFNRE